MSMITAAKWVPRGFAAPFPTRCTLDDAEFERIMALTKVALEEAKDDMRGAQEDSEEEEAKQKQIEEERRANTLAPIRSVHVQPSGSWQCYD